MRPHDHDTLLAYLDALAGRTPSAWLEVRTITLDGRADRRFVPTRRLRAAARFITEQRERGDVYLGVAPRARPLAGRAAIGPVSTLWVDYDDPAGGRPPSRFRLPASIVIASGSQGALHAYWLLTSPVTPAEAEELNRALARALDADVRCAHAAALLRPPGTCNHKRSPPAPVRVERLSGQRYDVAEVRAALAQHALAAAPHTDRCARRAPAGDPLRAIPPDVYVARLLGVPVPRSRKIRCPFHPDTTPSLHVYPQPERGWFCFGCRRGGSVYDLAAALWDVPTRGAAFRKLRTALHSLLEGKPGRGTA